MNNTYTLDDLRRLELASPGCREQLYAALDRAGLPRPNLAPPLTGAYDPRASNVCQDGQHALCLRVDPFRGVPAGFRCYCLCHQATNADRGQVLA